MRQRVLLVEDADEAALVVRDALSQSCQILVAKTVDEAAATIEQHDISLVLLDLTLPLKDGYALLARLQGSPQTASLPVICLTGRAEISDKVAAFSMGAEEYLVKPVDPLELRARVDAKLRRLRSSRESGDWLIVGSLEIDRSSHAVYVCSRDNSRESVALTPKEFKILCQMARQPDRVFTREQLMIGAWGNDGAVFDRAVDVHVCGIRRKLGVLGHYVQAIPGVGYKLTAGKNKI